jgi:hypothetical protein
MAVTETWFSEDIDNSLATIRGYNFFRKDRHNRRGGDLCIYVSELFHANRRTDLENDNFKCCGFVCASFVYLDLFVA